MQTLIYWLPFVALAILSFAKPTAQRPLLIAAAIALIVFVGLRHQVGTDWGTYATWVEEAGQRGLLTALAKTDWGYAFLNWLGANGLGGIYFVNAVCAVLAIVPLVWFCATRKNPALALLVAVPYLITVVSMNYTRQSVAIGFAMLAILAVERRRIGPFLAAITIAALFHKSAVCLFILAPALFAGNWNRASFLRLGYIALYAFALTLVMLSREAHSLYREYILYAGDAEIVAGVGPSARARVQSAGAGFRLAQLVVAAAAFAIIARLSRLSSSEFWLWTIMSTCVLVLFPMSFFRSTLADRIGLFFIPLQIHAFSTLPDLLKGTARFALIGMIITCLAAIFLIWLTFSSYSAHWLPYRSVIAPWAWS